jgi:hypothetical protein
MYKRDVQTPGATTSILYILILYIIYVQTNEYKQMSTNNILILYIIYVQTIQ